MKALMTFALATAALGLCACPAAEKLAKPVVAAPPSWRTAPGWRASAPADALPRDGWWKIFGESELDALEAKLEKQSPQLTAAEARLASARALTRGAAAAYYPTVTADGYGLEQRISGNRMLNGSTAATHAARQGELQPTLIASYEADFFHRNKMTLSAANESLQATAATTANTRLILEAELAADYWRLRALDEELRLVGASIDVARRLLDQSVARHEAGLASELEISQQKALLRAAEAQAELLRGQREGSEHAIAVLMGEAPEGFAIAAKATMPEPPSVPLATPAALLERRPDIAAAERLAAYQAEQVGLARAAFYPHIVLSAAGGLQSRELTSLLNGPSAIWSLGADIAAPLINGGRNKETLASKRKLYEASVEDYRATALGAMQEVEDALSTLAALRKAVERQREAVSESERAMSLIENRHQGGVASLVETLNAEATLLGNRRTLAQLEAQQWSETIYLARALGGGWSKDELDKLEVKPDKHQMLER